MALDDVSVTLPQELKKPVGGRNIVLLHNHPNNTGVSRADFSAAPWLDAEVMLVVNPDGALHGYALSPDLAYWAQTLSEIGNPPEMVMRREAILSSQNRF